MARLKAANNAITKLTVGITAADTSFTVEDATLFPDAPFRVTIDAEIMQVEVIDKLTNTFSAVQRGLEGTVAAPHNNGAVVANRWTAGYFETLATLEEAQAMATTAESEAKTYAEAYADDVAANAETDLIAHKAETAIHKTSDAIRTETTTPIKVEVVSSSGSETPEQGRIIFDMSQGKFFGGNGSGWV